jgi:hypothetical protein
MVRLEGLGKLNKFNYFIGTILHICPLKLTVNYKYSLRNPMCYTLSDSIKVHFLLEETRKELRMKLVIRNYKVLLH